tara:strand:+ start:297 stop:506 length:210 start_codon:yes stop_codon:yes gene_type:complete
MGPDNLMKIGRASGAIPGETNKPVTLTGKQINVKDPIDTKKATETLKIQRQNDENLLTSYKLRGKRKLF